MTISLLQLRNASTIEKVIIHSLESCLYQVSVVIAGREYFVVDDSGRFLRSHNKLDLQARFQHLPVVSTVLRQQSAYDEMVGLPLRQGGNTLEVPLGYPSFPD